jgi:hypothetical protein
MFLMQSKRNGKSIHCEPTVLPQHRIDRANKALNVQPSIMLTRALVSLGLISATDTDT